MAKLGLQNRRGRHDKIVLQTKLRTGSRTRLNKTNFNPTKVMHNATVTSNHEPSSLIPYYHREEKRHSGEEEKGLGFHNINNCKKFVKSRQYRTQKNNIYK